MPDKPLLLLPRSAPMPREVTRRMIRNNLRLPGRQDQGQRLGPQFTNMLEAFVTDAPAGTSTENILVLETIGRPENFRTAVASVPGLRWLAEIDQEVEADARFFERPKIGSRFFKDRVFALDARDSREITASLKANGVIDEDGILQEGVSDDQIHAVIPEDYREQAEQILAAINEEKASPLPGRMYLSLSNRQALQEIKRMFDTWEQGGRLRFGAGAWGEIFSHLRTMRFWNAKDRVTETGILDYWQKEVAYKRGTASMVAFEIELSYEDDEPSRRERQRHVEALVVREGGTVIASCDMKEIHFHAIKVELPVANIERVLGEDYSALFQDGGILFFRPSPQCAVDAFADGVADDIPPLPEPEEPPVVAVLDGLPFSRHNLLNGFVIIDDPDNFADDYPPREMNHGTAMVSLICHGELDAGENPITRKVYVRPILRPDTESPQERRPERIPKNVFFEDLVERAVRKMFAEVAGEPASAPSVRIINLSVADPDRMFHQFPGPTARLLDWLSFKYKVLFCVSAGNIKEPVLLGVEPDEFSALTGEEKVSVALRTWYGERRNRRLLAPSESINSLTVGALHDDASTPVILDGCLDILPSTDLPSPLSPLGHGFRSSVKPDIVVPGGRQFFTHIGDGEYNLPRLTPRSGQKVAAVPVMAGDRTRTTYTCGTSNANALAVRGASFIHDAVLDVLEEHGIENYEDSMAALIKTLLVHGASWGEAADIIESAVLNGEHTTEVKKGIARCLGYGRPDFAKVINCTASRATAIGFGVIAKDQRHEYQLPLPPSLSGLDCWRRLTITLAWLSPISVDSRKYRKAALTFEATEPANDIGGSRAEAQWQQVRNGTLQHEIIEGAEVRAFQEGQYLVIPVQCREDAGPLNVEVPYGLVVSLEVKEDVDLPLYEEIRSLIEVSVRETVRVV
ncbi:S8 family peptidase [Geobacter sp. DSM 9736]|uniref:S8 family peptidase n=1 Tax=Geobacter sp. DSM 9736 TaxID=1277350 RepID=UPI000B605BAA|nr:S8 family peptidase [Geobacter sp. DSM 9736]SNB47478.1 Subtilase family protein [Geobacter sp. DSM 9736]